MLFLVVDVSSMPCLCVLSFVYLITVWISIQGLHKICCSFKEDLLQRTQFEALTFDTVYLENDKKKNVGVSHLG